MLVYGWHRIKVNPNYKEITLPAPDKLNCFITMR
jgi:hypothetical protein